MNKLAKILFTIKMYNPQSFVSQFLFPIMDEMQSLNNNLKQCSQYAFQVLVAHMKNNCKIKLLNDLLVLIKITQQCFNRFKNIPCQNFQSNLFINKAIYFFPVTNQNIQNYINFVAMKKHCQIKASPQLIYSQIQHTNIINKLSTQCPGLHLNMVKIKHKKCINMSGVNATQPQSFLFDKRSRYCHFNSWKQIQEMRQYVQSHKRAGWILIAKYQNFRNKPRLLAQLNTNNQSIYSQTDSMINQQNKTNKEWFVCQ